MGQYYGIYMINETTKEITATTYIGGEILGKLLEHAWWNNKAVNTICAKIYKNPCRVGWIGDYANDTDCNDDIYDAVWNVYNKHEDLSSISFDLKGKYLCNHDTNHYISFDNYKAQNRTPNGELLHPLPLLTVIGNGMGLGDYYGCNDECVGDYYMNLISIEDEAPDGYVEDNYIFCIDE